MLRRGLQIEVTFELRPKRGAANNHAKIEEG
jgi:hypothetical protein